MALIGSLAAVYQHIKCHIFGMNVVPFQAVEQNGLIFLLSVTIGFFNREPCKITEPHK